MNAPRAEWYAMLRKMFEEGRLAMPPPDDMLDAWPASSKGWTGPAGNGLTDDTAALQAAIDQDLFFLTQKLKGHPADLRMVQQPDGTWSVPKRLEEK